MAGKEVVFQDDGSGAALAMAKGAVALHLMRAEARGEEPTGLSDEIQIAYPDGTTDTVLWPMTMPVREDHIILGYD